MNPDHVKVLLLLKELLISKDTITEERLLQELRHLTKSGVVRVEIFYAEYNENMAAECQRIIEDLVNEKQFELAARARDQRNMYVQKVKEIERYFGNSKAPTFDIDRHGMLRCLLDVKAHERLILSILAVS
jgi:hypothetical protein